jgi:hypothetical protein
MNLNFSSGLPAPVFCGSASPSSAAIVDIAFTGTAPRTLTGLTLDESAEFERLDRLSPVDHLGNCLWDFEGDPKTPDEKRWLELYRKHEASRALGLRRNADEARQASDRPLGKEVSCPAVPHCSTAWRRGATVFIATLSTACMALFAGEARAQCSARDVLQNHLTLKKIPSANIPPIPVGSAFNLPVWKTITVGTFADALALRNALDVASCGVGNSAGEILTRPAFSLGDTKTNVELLAVTAAELGFQTATAPLASIYARAQQLGFGLATAEVAPQLRLQYFDQPIGEFLIIGMEPIKTWNGESVILNVANGGAGLILFGQDGSADAEISTTSRFLFVRSKETALATAAHGAQ